MIGELSVVEFNPLSITDQVNEWYQLFMVRSLFVNTSTLNKPVSHHGFNSLIVVHEQLTLNELLRILQSEFEIKTDIIDFDSAVPANDRSPKYGTYSVLVRNRLEADAELKNILPILAVEMEVAGMTLMERLLLEYKFFKKTGKHLDTESHTICSGSRYADGSVPLVGWNSLESVLEIDFASADETGPQQRIREVVV